MAVVAVTGGTGTLGRHVVAQLAEAGHDVRVLSRRTAPGVVTADVRTGAGLDVALDGADVVVHAASNPARRARRTEVDGTRNVLRAAGRAHVVYVSIVGVDRHRFSYYRAKLAAEQLVEQHAGPWTIQRATQFHELLDRVLGAPVFLRTPNLACQPIAAREVAASLVAHVDAGPAGRAPDIGGPEVLRVADMAATRRRITGRAARLVPAPRFGPLADFDAGVHLCPDRAVGRTTWDSWLREAHPAA